MQNKCNNLVLIGIDYVGELSSGDKNYWYCLLKELTAINNIYIISLTNKKSGSEYLNYYDSRIELHYLNNNLNNINSDVKSLSRWELFVEKIKYANKILKLVNNIKHIDHIHFMDNLGIVNRYLAANVSTSISISAMSYQGMKFNSIYNFFLKLVFSRNNIFVIPYSKSYKNKLLEIGITPSNVRQIPWGVSQNDCSCPTPAIRDEVLILWTGYIQQIKKNDFLYALKIAKRALENGLKARFIFAFKPESYERQFEVYNDPDNGITIQSTTLEEFIEIKKKTSIMFSPVVWRPLILAPPLTWIEMMGNGVPVVTTNVPGADEAVVDGITGYIADSAESLINALFRAVESYDNMAEGCRERIRTQYNIENSAKAYLQLWNELSARKGVNA